MRFTERDALTFGNKRWRMEHLYKIKNESAKLVFFKFNDVQEELYKYCESLGHKGIETIQDKARKEGVSTFWLIYYLDESLFNPNTTSLIIAHVKPDVQKLFKIVKLGYNSCPNKFILQSGDIWRKPGAVFDNVNELTFSKINSTIYVALENRGDTPNNLHISEAAHIKDPNRILATLASVPDNKRSNISIESTANGVGDWFEETFHECEAGHGSYKPFFFGWWQKAGHSLVAPKDYQPTQECNNKADLVKARHGVILTRDQMFWWDKTKKKLRKLMDQEHPTVSEDSFLTAVGMVFDPEGMARIEPTAPYCKRPIRIETAEGKMVTYYADIYVMPKPGRKYVIGGDPAEGVEGDNSVVEVYDDLTLEQVAEFYNNTIKPADLAKIVDNLARFYNNGLAAVERNNHGHLVLDRLKDIYSNIFYKVTFDEKTNKKTKKIGWETNGVTRDLILDEFENLVADLLVKIHSAILKSEMLTFITDDTGKRTAKSGKHDDAIMASAIALKVARMPRASFEVNSVN